LRRGGKWRVSQRKGLTLCVPLKSPPCPLRENWFRLRPIGVLLALVLALGISGCSKQARQASLQARADGYFKAGEYDKAKIEYMNLLREDNKNATAFHQIGLIWFEQGAPLQAFPFLL